jgi:hypothetical protein
MAATEISTMAILFVVVRIALRVSSTTAVPQRGIGCNNRWQNI